MRMTSNQIIKRSLSAVIVAKPFTVKDHVEATLIMNNGSNAPSCFVLPAYLHRATQKLNSVIKFIPFWFCRKGLIGAESRDNAARHRHYNRRFTSKYSAALSGGSALPVNHNHAGYYRAGRF